MYVKIKKEGGLGYRGERLAKGETAEVDNTLGAKWVTRGWAEETTRKPKPKPIETAAVDTGEKAVKATGAPRKVKKK